MPKMHKKAQKKRKLFKQQRGLCWLCGEVMGLHDSTFDHLIPRAKLGGSALENLKLAHMACNSKRGHSSDAVFVRHNGIVALRWNVRSIGYI